MERWVCFLHITHPAVAVWLSDHFCLSNHFCVSDKKKKKTLQKREKRGARHNANLLTPPKYLGLIKTHPSSLTNLINSACRGFHTDNVILHSNLLA